MQEVQKQLGIRAAQVWPLSNNIERRRNFGQHENHNSMTRYLLILILILTAFSLPLVVQAQTKINPTTQINWPSITGSGAPSGGTCSSINYGRSYVDISTNPVTSYTCGPYGWQESSGSGGSVGTAGQVQMVGGPAGSFAASSCRDNGIIWTCTEAINTPTMQVGTPSTAAKAALPAGAHGWAFDETSTVGTPATGVDYFRADSVKHAIVESLNGGAEVALPSSAFSLISKVVLGSAASTITFTSIPNTFTDLQLSCDGRGDTGASTTPLMTFNGDTGNNYDLTEIYAGGTGGNALATGAWAQPYIALLAWSGPSSSANYPGMFEAYLHNYTGAFYKGITIKQGNQINAFAGNSYILYANAWWKNTGAITSITITSSTANFVANSHCSLYGVL